MTGLAIVPRRKATTYGKSSRSSIVTAGNAFAQISVTEFDIAGRHYPDNILNSTTTLHRGASALAPNAAIVKGDRRVVGSSLKARSQQLQDRPLQQHRSTSTTDNTTDEDNVFDVPSSEDEKELKHRAPRKRRKLRSSECVVENPYVYDDTTLQRYVATEAASELEKTRPESPFKRNDKSDKERQAYEGHISVHVSGQRNIKASLGTKPRRGDNSKAKKSTSLAESHSLAPMAKRKYTKSAVRSLVLESATDVAALIQPCGIRTSSCRISREKTPPSTPPRGNKSLEGATTPRQRELWNRLLVDVANSASPNALDLPGLVPTEQKLWSPEASSTAHGLTCANADSMTPRSRPRKLVDTLCSIGDGPSSRNASDSDSDTVSIKSDGQPVFFRSDNSQPNDVVTARISATTKNQRGPRELQDNSLSHLSRPLPSLSQVSLKVTYARQRSYLTDDDLNDAAMLSAPLMKDVTSKNFGQRMKLVDGALLANSTQNLAEHSTESQEAQGGAMRSIHELREAGGNARLVSELEAVLDDIDDQQTLSATFRRSRLTDLVLKLQEPTRRRLFIDHGFELRLLVCVTLEKANDMITDFLYAAAIHQLLVGPGTTSLLAHVGDIRVINFLIRLLQNDQDLKLSAELRHHSLSKVTRQEHQILCDTLLKSGGYRAGTPSFISCKVLALQCLDHFVRKIRDAGSGSQLLSAHAMGRIITNTIPSFSAPSRLPTAQACFNIELALSVLEACTTINAADCQESLWAGDILGRVVGLLPLLAASEQKHSSASHCLTLRLYLNLTNNNPVLCEDFSTSEITTVLFESIIAGFDRLADRTCEVILVLDTLILSLGLFINLAESSETVRRLVRELRRDNKQSYLDALLVVYDSRSKSASEVRSRLIDYCR